MIRIIKFEASQITRSNRTFDPNRPLFKTITGLPEKASVIALIAKCRVEVNIGKCLIKDTVRNKHRYVAHSTAGLQVIVQSDPGVAARIHVVATR